MRVLLCNNKTGLYYQSAEQWTSEPALAKDFRSSLKAVIYAEECELPDVEVFMDFDDPEYNVHLPVRRYLSGAIKDAEPETSAA